jgi:hypothetical protein
LHTTPTGRFRQSIGSDHSPPPPGAL